MIRRFNYTNRIRINRKDIAIILRQQNDDYWFDADLSKIREYEMSEDSLVYVEAYRQTNWRRFSYGRLSDLVPDNDRSLALFESPEGIRFRVKVTPPDDVHRLLAEADEIPLLRPEEQQVDRKPLLPVKPERLESEIYRLDLSNSPLLLINKDAGIVADIAKSPEFEALVYPAILRQILTRIIVIEKFDDETSSEDWRSQWLQFVRRFPGIEAIPDTDAVEECENWIDSAVSAFAKSNQVFSKFTESWKGGA